MDHPARCLDTGADSELEALGDGSLHGDGHGVHGTLLALIGRVLCEGTVRTPDFTPITARTKVTGWLRQWLKAFHRSPA